MHVFSRQRSLAACAALHLAVLLPTASSWTEGRASAGAISLAVADANSRFPVKLAYKWKAVDCDATQATAAISLMLQDDVVDAVIGPDCEDSCESSAYLTAGRNIAQISYSCSSDLLSDKKKYPTVRPCFPNSAPVLWVHPLVLPHSAQRGLTVLTRGKLLIISVPALDSTIFPLLVYVSVGCLDTRAPLPLWHLQSAPGRLLALPHLSHMIRCAVPTHNVELFELDARYCRLCEVVQMVATLALLSPQVDFRVHSCGALARTLPF